MTYPILYGETYGAGWPMSPAPAKAEVSLGGAWTDISPYVLQRDGTAPAIQIQRGRPDETSTANPASCQMQWKNRDGRFTIRNPLGPYYGQLNRNTRVRVSVPDVTSFLRIEDDAASSAQFTPRLAPGTGSQDIRLDLQLSGYSPCALASLWGSGQRAWLLALNGDGTLTLYTSTDGTTATLQSAQSGMPLPLGPVVLRAWLDKATGNVTFYTAPPGGILAGPFTQLGQVVTSMSGGRTLFASTAPVRVGHNATAVSDFLTSAGLTGRVADFTWGPAAGAPVTQAGFTSLPAGTMSWTDADGQAWTLTGTASIDNASYRFHGELSGLPVAWDPTGSDIWAPVTASGILRRIQDGNTPAPSPMRRYVKDDIIVRAYWPLEDGLAATQFGPGITGGFPLVISRGSPNFAADTSFACSAALPQVNNAFASGVIGAYADTGTMVIRFLLNIPSGFASRTAFLRFGTTGAAGAVYFFYDSTGGGLGAFSTGGSSNPGSGFDFSGTEVPYTPGKPVLVSLELLASGGSVTPTFRTLSATGAITSSTYASYSGTTGRATDVAIAPTGDVPAWPAGPGGTVLGHIYVQSAFNELSGTPQSVIQAWAGETAGNRFARLCAENGIQARVYGYPSVTAAMGAQAQGTLTELLQECETADMGIIYEPRTCAGLGYRTLASLCGQAPAVTLDYSQAHLGQAGQEGEWQPTPDDQQTRNDIQVTRGSAASSLGASFIVNQGATYTAALDDGSPLSTSPPPAGVGDYNTQVTANVQADAQLPDMAGWLLHIGTTADERYPDIPLNLARAQLAGLYAAIISLDLGDCCQVINPPPWAPPGPVRQLVYGAAEKLGGFWYLVGWQGVPESPYETVLLDDDVLGREDTGGSQLHAGIGGADTSMLVDTTSPSGIVWTTGTGPGGQGTGDFPLQVVMGGEVITVADIQGPFANFLSGQPASFDGGIGTWVAQGNTAISPVTSPVYAGSGAMALTAAAAGNMQAAHCLAGNIATQGLPCSPGDVILMSAWFRAATAPRTCNMGAQFFTAAGVAFSNVNDTADQQPDTTTGWTKVAGSVTAPAGSAFCRLFPIVQAAGAGEQHFMDLPYIAHVSGGVLRQTFAGLTRSVNGVVKSHAAGEDIRLAEPAYLAVT